MRLVWLLLSRICLGVINRRGKYHVKIQLRVTTNLSLHLALLALCVPPSRPLAPGRHGAHAPVSLPAHAIPPAALQHRR